MKIGLLGCGTVGSGVKEIIEKIPSFEITKILVRDLDENSTKNMTTDFSEVMASDIDVIIEVMGGLHPAYEYIMEALNKGKHVITANKAVVCEYYQTFIETAQKKHVHFLFEASCGGGIPWIKNLMRAKRIDQINEISGIFNGTTNYILDAMHKYDVTFSEVLKKAQELGYAEADPSADIDGFDIQRKCMISTSLAFDTIIDPNQICVEGIRNITTSDIACFKNKHQVCKLMAFAKYHHNECAVYVEPTLFDENELESSVPANFNLVTLYGNTIGELKFYGQGAGKLPTANAVVSDLLDILNHEIIPVSLSDNRINVNNETEKHRYYLRVNKTAKINESLMMECLNYEYNKDTIIYITNKITVSAMHQKIKKIREEDPRAFFAGIAQYQR